MSKRLLEMRSLVHIRIMSKYLGRFPPPASSYWPGVSHSKDIALRYARDMHAICPTLQYIQIKRYLWQVVPHNSTLCTFNDCRTKHDFVEIDEDETHKIEHFSYAMAPDQGYLLGAETPHTEPPENKSNFDALENEMRLDEDISFRGPPWKFGDSDGNNVGSDDEQSEVEADSYDYSDSENGSDLQDMLCTKEPALTKIEIGPPTNKLRHALGEDAEAYRNDIMGLFYAIQRDGPSSA